MLQLVLEGVHGPHHPNVSWYSVVVYCSPVEEAVVAQPTGCIILFPIPKTSSSCLPGSVGMISVELLPQVFRLA